MGALHPPGKARSDVARPRDLLIRLPPPGSEKRIVLAALLHRGAVAGHAVVDSGAGHGPAGAEETPPASGHPLRLNEPGPPYPSNHDAQIRRPKCRAAKLSAPLVASGCPDGALMTNSMTSIVGISRIRPPTATRANCLTPTGAPSASPDALRGSSHIAFVSPVEAGDERVWFCEPTASATNWPSPPWSRTPKLSAWPTPGTSLPPRSAITRTSSAQYSNRNPSGCLTETPSPRSRTVNNYTLPMTGDPSTGFGRGPTSSVAEVSSQQALTRRLPADQ